MAKIRFLDTFAKNIPKMNKAIFLDRDGVINKELGDYVYRLADLEVIAGVIDSLVELKARGYLLIVITNQSGIAKKIYGHQEVQAIHSSIAKSLEAKGVEIAAFYYCPHHPEFSNCLCRKPGSVMVEKAMARFNIDPAVSYFVGDRDRDVEAGEAVGVKGVKIEANMGLQPLLDLL